MPPASIGQIDGQGPYIFEMSATGIVSTSAGESLLPRGIYQFFIIRADTGAKVMELAEGIVLVAGANSELIEGSLYVQRFVNLSTSLSGIAGDEPPREPHIITFRFERRR